MPITRSAKKALRQNVTRKARNLKSKNRMKQLVKQVKKLAGQNKLDEARKLISQMYKAFDKAAKTGILQKNTAARRKSRMSKFLARER